MKILLKDKFGKDIGYLEDLIEANVTEERNGLFELDITFKLGSIGWDKIDRGVILTANAGDNLKDQQFRVYRVSKPLSGMIIANCRHISYDLARDVVNSINIENQSCEYALNTIFRQSQFSQSFTGKSDIINAQNFKISNVNCLSAIGGAKGSVLDTYGTCAELFRNNKVISVLNRRGHDNNVTIEYAKNLTGLDCTEDDSNLVTRIKAIAKYTEAETEKQLYTYVDSPLVNNYETPFIKEIDFTDKFKESEIPTTAKLKTFAERYFRDNECDKIKTNYKISFIPLSKCLGFEGIEDKINLCDVVTIKDYRYNLNTQAKVIKTVFNCITDRYESMEIGNVKTTLGDLIGQGGEGEKGDKGDKGDKGEDGNIGDFPDSLPDIPILHAEVLGFASVDLSWTFENKVYYNYQLFASKVENFNPTIFDMIFEGQASAFLHQVKPSETWYYRVRAINTYGNFTEFSTQLKVETKKIDDFDEYFSSLAVGNLVTNIFSTDYMTAGIIKAHWLDARNLSVTDGNGKRTLDIDSFGNVNLDVSTLKIKSIDVEKNIENTNSRVSKVEQLTTSESIINTVSSTIDSKVNPVKSSVSELKQNADKFQFSVKTTQAYNILLNSRPKQNVTYWSTSNGGGSTGSITPVPHNSGINYKGDYFKSGIWWEGRNVPSGSSGWCILKNNSISNYNFNVNKKYTISFLIYSDWTDRIQVQICDADSSNKVYASDYVTLPAKKYTKITRTFTPVSSGNNPEFRLSSLDANGETYRCCIPWVNLYEGELQYEEHLLDERGEIEGITTIDRNGIRCDFEDGTYAAMGKNGLRYYHPSMNKPYQYITFTETYKGVRNGVWRKIQLPSVFVGKKLRDDFQLMAWAGAVDSDAFANKKKDAIRTLFIEIKNWNSSNATVYVRPCLQKIGVVTATHWGWDAETTTSGNTIGEGKIDILVMAQM